MYALPVRDVEYFPSVTSPVEGPRPRRPAGNSSEGRRTGSNFESSVAEGWQLSEQDEKPRSVCWGLVSRFAVPEIVNGQAFASCLVDLQPSAGPDSRLFGLVRALTQRLFSERLKNYPREPTFSTNIKIYLTIFLINFQHFQYPRTPSYHLWRTDRKRGEPCEIVENEINIPAVLSR